MLLGLSGRGICTPESSEYRKHQKVLYHIPKRRLKKQEIAVNGDSGANNYTLVVIVNNKTVNEGPRQVPPCAAWRLLLHHALEETVTFKGSILKLIQLIQCVFCVSKNKIRRRLCRVGEIRARGGGGPKSRFANFGLSKSLSLLHLQPQPPALPRHARPRSLSRYLQQLTTDRTRSNY